MCMYVRTCHAQVTSLLLNSRDYSAQQLLNNAEQLLNSAELQPIFGSDGKPSLVPCAVYELDTRLQFVTTMWPRLTSLDISQKTIWEVQTDHGVRILASNLPELTSLSPLTALNLFKLATVFTRRGTGN